MVPRFSYFFLPAHGYVYIGLHVLLYTEAQGKVGQHQAQTPHQSHERIG